MDYKNRYREVIEKANALYKIAEPMSGCNVILETLFPELKESEDERIRKGIIDFLWKEKIFLQEAHLSVDNNPKYRFVMDAIAWLEKQGEQNSIWHNEDEEPQRDSLILLIMQSGTPIVAKIIEPNHTFNHGERWAYIDDLLEKRGEQKVSYTTLVETGNGEINALVTKELPINGYDDKQKPAWSEEDENRINRLIAYFEDKESFTAEDDIVYANWLKSLRQRIGWKPSNEQIKALHDLNLTGNMSYTGQGQTLIELYNDLKKLTE